MQRFGVSGTQLRELAPFENFCRQIMLLGEILAAFCRSADIGVDSSMFIGKCKDLFNPTISNISCLVWDAPERY